MKKTATKTTASTKSATAAKASPAKKPAAAEPKAKKTAPAIKAAPVVKKSPAAKKSPAKTTTASPEIRTTTIVAAIDVGFGNSLSLRGEGAGLSWEKGTLMECVSGDVWSISLAETAHPIVCKFLINDQVWCTGDDYTVLPGSSVVLSPTF
jgi:hypothetical protein